MNIFTEVVEIKNGIKQLEQNCGVQVFDGIDTIYASQGEKNCFTKKGSNISIVFTSVSMFFAVLGQALTFKDEQSEEVEVIHKFKKLGIMLDCARNAVPNVKALKRFIAASSLMGYNYLELYVEDCFEVDGEPYFGYMRSRYKKSELKDLDEYCKAFGIELVPCIQTLAHLSRIFLHWNEYTSKIRDKGDVLLVGEERTYDLIENMLKTCRECFSSNNINIGMDEAFELGKGEYFNRNGYVPSQVIMREHLSRVLSLCKKYNYHPAMWADMFYNEIDEGKASDIPKDVEYIFWDYTTKDEAFYKNRFAKMQKLVLKHSFAGGAHKWYGFTPQNTFSELVLNKQVKICEKCGVENFKLTLWGDEGAECSYFAVISTLAYLAEQNSKNKSFAKNICKLITGYTNGELKCLDLPNKLYDKPIDKILNPSKYLLYVDAFLGVEEFTSSKDYSKRYALIANKLKRLSNRKSYFAYLFKTQYHLCKVLELKSTLTEEIDLAYKQKDKECLKSLANKNIPLIIKRLKEFIAVYRKQFLYENRPMGVEVQEYRLFGLVGRLQMVKERIDDYLSEKIDCIPELEEQKLYPIPGESDEYNGCKLYNGFAVNVTYSTM